ncbi:MAG: hypothetical protein SGCHY_004508 [Lobulomycetales sp.]
MEAVDLVSWRSPMELKSGNKSLRTLRTTDWGPEYFYNWAMKRPQSEPPALRQDNVLRRTSSLGVLDDHPALAPSPSSNYKTRPKASKRPSTWHQSLSGRSSGGGMFSFLKRAGTRKPAAGSEPGKYSPVLEDPEPNDHDPKQGQQLHHSPIALQQTSLSTAHSSTASIASAGISISATPHTAAPDPMLPCKTCFYHDCLRPARGTGPDVACVACPRCFQRASIPTHRIDVSLHEVMTMSALLGPHNTHTIVPPPMHAEALGGEPVFACGYDRKRGRMSCAATEAVVGEAFLEMIQRRQTASPVDQTTKSLVEQNTSLVEQDQRMETTSLVEQDQKSETTSLVVEQDQ